MSPSLPPVQEIEDGFLDHVLGAVVRAVDTRLPVERV
jgi:hypothetical protein